MRWASAIWPGQSRWRCRKASMTNVAGEYGRVVTAIIAILDSAVLASAGQETRSSGRCADRLQGPGVGSMFSGQAFPPSHRINGNTVFVKGRMSASKAMQVTRPSRLCVAPLPNPNRFLTPVKQSDSICCQAGVSGQHTATGKSGYARTQRQGGRGTDITHRWSPPSPPCPKP